MEPLVDIFRFLLEIRVTLNLRAKGAEFFKKYFCLFEPKGPKMGSKSSIFEFNKQMCGILVIFCMNLQHYQLLKLTLMIFHEKLVLRFLDLKETKISSK